VVVGGGEWGASRPIPLPPSQPVDGVISTKKLSEASFAGRNLILCHHTLMPLFQGLGSQNDKGFVNYGLGVGGWRQNRQPPTP